MKSSKEVGKRALIDLVGSPQVVIPGLIGLTSLMASWAVDGSPLMTLTGILGITGAIGMYVTSMLIWKDDILDKTKVKLAAEEAAKLNERLDELDKKLRSNRDPRDQTMLRELRDIYTSFKNDKLGTVAAAYAVNGIVDNMFYACIQQLETSYNVWETQRQLTGGERKQKLKDQRDKMLAEIERTIDQIRKAVDDLHVLDLSDSSTNLGELGNQLELQLKAAKEAEARIRGHDPDLDDLEKELSQLQ